MFARVGAAARRPRVCARGFALTSRLFPKPYFFIVLTPQVNFGNISNSSARTVFLAVTPHSDPTLVFHPHMNRRSLAAYSLTDGERVLELNGHYDIPICVAFHPLREVSARAALAVPIPRTAVHAAHARPNAHPCFCACACLRERRHSCS